MQSVTELIAVNARRCHGVLQQLRPHLTSEQLRKQVERQYECGYRLVILEEDGIVMGVAGYRLLENLGLGQVFIR